MSAPLFDCHVHLGPSDSGELYYPHLSGEEYLRLMDDAGVRRSIAFAPFMVSGYAESNRSLANWCDKTEGRVRPLARVGGRHIGWTEPQLWLLRRKLRRLAIPPAPDLEPDELDRFAGLKLLPHLDGLPSAALFETCNELGLPVLTHAGRYVQASWIARAILPKVRTKLILAHLGAFPDCRPHLEEAVELAASDPRVYLDTSGIWIADFFRYALDRAPRKILFGSDAPLTTPAVAWKMVASAVDDAGLLRRIGGEAAAEVFGP